MRTQRWILSSITLAGLYGCHAGEDAPAGEPKPRDLEVGPIFEIEKCLTDSYVLIKHKDGTSHASDDIQEGLASHVRAGDYIEAMFGLSPACAAKHGSRVTLAAYTTGGIDKLVHTNPPAPAYDMDTTMVGEDAAVLTLHVPDCMFRVELAHGEPLGALSQPDGTYAAEGRSIVTVEGGDDDCKDVPKLAIESFDTVERGWGDAPLLTHFGWSFVAEEGTTLGCDLDLDGDGVVDKGLYPCTPNTAGLKLAALPSHTYINPGESRPTIVVSDGTRRLWASTSVLANKLDFKPNVRFPHKLLSFTNAWVMQQDGQETIKVTLKYTTSKGMPVYKIGDILVGDGPARYMMKVSKAVMGFNQVTYTGTLVGLDEVVAGGYFGVRDVRLSTEGAYCTSQCVGELIPVDQPPGAQVGEKMLAFDAPEADTEHKYGIKLGIDLPTGGNVELFGGVVIKKFAIDGLAFGDLHVDIEIAPTIEAVAAITAAAKAELKVGEWFLAALPTPVPVSLKLTPKFVLDSTLKFAGKFTGALTLFLKHQAGQWDKGIKRSVTGSASLLEGAPGGELSLESKLTVVPGFAFELGGFMKGPSFAPTGSIGIKATQDVKKCEFCMTVFGELGGLIGWEAPWGLGDIIDPITFTAAEVEFIKKCDPVGIGVCQPPPPPPPGGGGGGSWGDVHVISHDGLLFDFQAGGEFVLVRATEGAPFEVQARQEPLSNNHSLSYNTAIATKVDGKKVGFYTQMPSLVYVGGEAQSLAEGASMQVGDNLAGTLARGVGGVYTLTYPGGEELKVLDRSSHLDVAVKLPPTRAGKIEGVLGNGNGDTADDIAVVGGFLPQPVDFDALYRGADSFAAAWRVKPGSELFDYLPGTSGDTFRSLMYTSMPEGEPAADPQYAAVAQEACAVCQPELVDACMLDVGFTNDLSFVASCTQPIAEIEDVIYPSNGFVAVSPRYGAAVNLVNPTGFEIVFIGPDLADADIYPQGHDLTVWIEGVYFDETIHPLQDFHTFTLPPGYPDTDNWGTQFTCDPLVEGSDWGKCTFQAAPIEPDPNVAYYTWRVSSNTDPDYHAEARFTGN
jgi:hypothetical protein